MLYLIAALSLLAIRLPAQSGNAFVGAEACRPCHAKQFTLQSLSGHARALQPGGPQADWAFGSGTHAITWVKQKDARHYLELGQSWFRRTDRMALTPGHTDSAGVTYRLFDSGAQILRCFSCHSTGPLEVSEAGVIQPHEAGVRCEVCHGPGQRHITSQGTKYSIENPARYSAKAVNESCGACHRQSKPGVSETDWSDAWNIRHQPVYLAESRCFLRSEGKLSCLSCHQPHEKLNQDATAYNAQCAACHPKPKHLSFGQQTGNREACTTCHMPKIAASPDIAFTNHWIGVYPGKSKLRPRR
ncbi:MAG: multiheme c-type cytochrome [Bryobacter sp.]|nr:multiheme c-type cytochrome [Bryobacter sp.]